ncbi:hypothetical protein K439DRAFT_1349322 [Ramaria rubella]|nr:hypothetical protein K439DRAFT_1349322 [Ramaria rubella]
MYHQYDSTRLATCTSCHHTLLHILLDIQRTGPVWVYWTFVIERFCGCLLEAMKSHSKPYTALSTRMLHQSQLLQIQLWFSLHEELNLEDDVQEISSKEDVYPECE